MLCQAAQPTWPKTAVERYRAQGKKGDIEKKRTFSSSAESVQCSLTVPSPHVCAINLSSSAARKVNIPLPHVSLSHTNIRTTTLSHIMIFLAPFSIFVFLVCFNTFNLLFLSLFLSYTVSRLHSCTSILSLCPHLSSLETGANTLQGLQSLAQLQLALVLNRI